ncbi:MAG: hypothetical protein HYV90_03165 [Candidatus Woesebacteria bacterium]|nr:MAG: hypothetical protein HYV90_03165 [Candidatus Woesebacteria bacterium]
MEIPTASSVLKDGETHVFSQNECPDGISRIEIHRLEQASSVNFIYETREEAERLESKLRNPDDEAGTELFKSLESSAKIIKGYTVDDKYRIGIIANWSDNKSFIFDVVQNLIALKLLPEDASKLLA